MSMRRMWKAKATCLAAPLMLAALAAPVGSQTCGPDVDGRVAAVDYRDTVIVWDPVVEYERMILTIGGPCEDIVKVFGRGEPIVFDLREIARVGDGVYTWELRREAPIDAATKKALATARATDDDRIWWNLWQKGAIPQGPYVDSASFTVAGGVIVPPGQLEEKSLPLAATPQRRTGPSFASTASPVSSGGHPFGFKDQVIPDDLVVQGSACVGFDCVNNVTFSDSTILMMENNTRIKFDDTSTLAGFPNNDWEIQANSSNSGGGSFLAINDCASSSQGGCADDPLFKVESGARANALYVESDGDVGVGTANPVLDLHVVTGNTPALRLDQDGSGGFTAQAWDVAGNEVNFFIRDVTGGSKLPFRIRPGAPTSSIDVASDGDVGIGTGSPAAKLHVSGSNGTTQGLISETSGVVASRTLLQMSNNGEVRLNFASTNTSSNWELISGTTFVVNRGGSGVQEMVINSGGNVTIAGTLTQNSDRATKTDINPVDPEAVLAKVARLPIATWRKIGDSGTHLGPMAQDFATAFGLGEDNRHVALIDLAGVSLAAIQALEGQIKAKELEIQSLQRRLAELETLVAKKLREN